MQTLAYLGGLTPARKKEYMTRTHTAQPTRSTSTQPPLNSDPLMGIAGNRRTHTAREDRRLREPSRRVLIVKLFDVVEDLLQGLLVGQDCHPEVKGAGLLAETAAGHCDDAGPLDHLQAVD